MVYVIAGVVYGLDQFIKWVVRSHMVVGQLIPVWPPVLSLDYIRNPGGAFGIFPDAKWLFVIVAIAVVLVVVYVNAKFHPNIVMRIGIALVMAGALGNLTDRIVSGTVVDYVYFQIINFPVFNLADLSVDVGAVLLIWQTALLNKVSDGMGSLRSKKK